ncbi:MAG: hypothetical protein NTX64_17740 [Elusimicrobia bacterium]|nr:hypothetical protein [Elusimicrobiota bacterium]
MHLGRVYRRRDLEKVTTAVDRDLKTLVASGAVRSLGRGLYYRPRKNPFGDTPPEERELVRAFLKTDDFLITSYNYFTDLGLGLTQVYNHCLVYNHKRGGDFQLGGRRFQFRVVRAFPRALSKEYLLVDLLNHVKKLPDDTYRVVKNLETTLREFDRSKLLTCLDRYGNFEAKRILGELLGQDPSEPNLSAGPGGASVARDRMAVRVVAREDPRQDLEFWLAKSPAERIAAVEFLRDQYYALSGCKSLPRLAHSIQLRSGRK